MKNKFFIIFAVLFLILSLELIVAQQSVSDNDINNFNNVDKRNEVISSLTDVTVLGLESDNIDSANLQNDGTFVIESDGRKFTGNVFNLPSDLKEIKFREQDNILEYGYKNGARVLTGQGGINSESKLTGFSSGGVEYKNIKLELGKNSIVRVDSNGKIEQWTNKDDKTTKIKISDKEFSGLPAKAGDESKNYGIVQIVEENVFEMRGLVQVGTEKVSYNKNKPESVVVSFKEDYAPSEENKGKYFQVVIGKKAVEQEDGTIKLKENKDSIVLGGDLNEAVGEEIEFSSGKGKEVYAILDDKDMYVPVTDVFGPGGLGEEVCGSPCRFRVVRFISAGIRAGLRGTANVLRFAGRVVGGTRVGIMNTRLRWMDRRSGRLERRLSRLQGRATNSFRRQLVAGRPLLNSAIIVGNGVRAIGGGVRGARIGILRARIGGIERRSGWVKNRRYRVRARWGMVG